jgi:ubiquinone/menaquinone biosynthesis C-methylase UbiE
VDADPEPATWSGIAGWYDTLIQAGSGPHQLATQTTLRLVPAVHDADGLDVACGQGLASRALAQAGARSVTGVDATPEMIEAGRRHEATTPLGIVYLVEDAQTLRSLPSEAFDIVTCQLGLMDIPDLSATLTAVHRVLRPGSTAVSGDAGRDGPAGPAPRRGPRPATPPAADPARTRQHRAGREAGPGQGCSAKMR